MRRKLIAGSLALTLAIPAAIGYQYFQVRHPVIEEAANGWEFNYVLCVPQPPPAACIKSPFKLVVQRGYEAAGMPYTHRMKDLETVDDARIEAEQRADMIENVHRQ